MFGFIIYSNRSQAQISINPHPHGPVNEVKKFKVVMDNNPPKAVVEAVEEEFGSIIPWYFEVGYARVLDAPFSKPFYLVSFVDLNNIVYLLSYSIKGELLGIVSTPL